MQAPCQGGALPINYLFVDSIQVPFFRFSTSVSPVRPLAAAKRWMVSTSVKEFRISFKRQLDAIFTLENKYREISFKFKQYSSDQP